MPLDPRLTAWERERVLAGLDPTLLLEDTDALAALLRSVAPEARTGLPRARPMHCTSGTTGTPKGVWSGLLPVPRAEALVAEEREACGASRPTTSTSCSARCTTPRRCASRWGRASRAGASSSPALRPGRRHRRHRGRAPDVDVLRPGPPPAPLRPLGRGGHARPVVVPARRARRRALPGGGQAPAGREFPAGSTWEFYGSTEGQFTTCSQRGVAGPPRHAGPRPPRAAPGHRRGRPAVVRCRPSTGGSSTTATRGRPPRPGGRPPTGRPSPSATSAGSTRTATSSSTAAASTS